ncbi:MAG: hypothetical protein WKF47_09180 [Geodermatophilaceae bacterium]
MVSWTVGNRHGITRWWYDVTARTATPADAETSAFAERPRSGQSMIVAPPAESAQRTPGSAGVPARSGGPAAADVPASPDRVPLRVHDELPEDGESEPDPGPAPPVSDDEREHRARIPSWEDIVFGVRRKRG